MKTKNFLKSDFENTYYGYEVDGRMSDKVYQVKIIGGVIQNDSEMVNLNKDMLWQGKKIVGFDIVYRSGIIGKCSLQLLTTEGEAIFIKPDAFCFMFQNKWTSEIIIFSGAIRDKKDDVYMYFESKIFGIANKIVENMVVHLFKDTIPDFKMLCTNEEEENGEKDIEHEE